MLEIIVPAGEIWNDFSEEFYSLDSPQVLRLEHSLLSIAKWESRWNKPFLSKTPKTREETIDYVRCMTLTQNVNPLSYQLLTTDNLSKIEKYIESPMTATTFEERGQTRSNREVLTNELIYYYMIALNVPFECQKWHLNRLLTLIRVCSIKNAPAQKMSRREILSRNRAMNNARRAKMHTKG